MSPPTLSSTEQDDFRDSTVGDSLVVSLIDSDGEGHGDIELTVTGVETNTRYAAGSDGSHYELMLSSGVLLVGEDGRELNGTEEEEGYMKTGTDEEGRSNYQKGKRESASWSFDYWATSFERHSEDLKLG